MIVSIDFDQTFTADPELFAAFAGLARQRGHTVIMVTGRADRVMHSDPSRHWGDEVREAIRRAAAGPHLLDALIFAADRPKRLAAEQAGYKVDVWVDDDPEHVGG